MPQRRIAGSRRLARWGARTKQQIFANAPRGAATLLANQRASATSIDALNRERKCGGAECEDFVKTFDFVYNIGICLPPAAGSADSSSRRSDKLHACQSRRALSWHVSDGANDRLQNVAA